MPIITYALAALVVVFVVSGVLPRYFESRARRQRVQKFGREYAAYGDLRDADYERKGVQYDDPPFSSESKAARSWLIARRDEMQRDAAALGKGVIHLAPPAAEGGGPWRSHEYFADLFGEQTYAYILPANYRADALTTLVYEAEAVEGGRRWALWNPWQWLRLSFERVVAFPRYVLTIAGFSPNVTDSSTVRVVTAIWSLLVGVAGIGSFVVTALHG
jgi:hypothetical protein